MIEPDEENIPLNDQGNDDDEYMMMRNIYHLMTKVLMRRRSQHLCLRCLLRVAYNE